jgi:hypothetical protein
MQVDIMIDLADIIDHVHSDHLEVKKIDELHECKFKKLTAVLSQLLVLLSEEEKKLKTKRRFRSSTQK